MRWPEVSPLQAGDAASRSRTFLPGDLAEYRALSDDAGLRFGGGDPGVPGPLLAGMISDLLGTTLPGLGTMWMKQSLEYSGSAGVGDEVVASVSISRLVPEKGLVYLASECRCGGVVVVSGRSLVMVSNLADRV